MSCESAITIMAGVANYPREVIINVVERGIGYTFGKDLLVKEIHERVVLRKGILGERGSSLLLGWGERGKEE